MTTRNASARSHRRRWLESAAPPPFLRQPCSTPLVFPQSVRRVPACRAVRNVRRRLGPRESLDRCLCLRGQLDPASGLLFRGVGMSIRRHPNHRASTDQPPGPISATASAMAASSAEVHAPNRIVSSHSSNPVMTAAAVGVEIPSNSRRAAPDSTKCAGGCRDTTASATIARNRKSPAAAERRTTLERGRATNAWPK